MLIRRTVLAGTTDSFPINGRYFSLIQGSNCRVNLLSNSARVFSSEVYEGMGTKLDVAITHVEIESKIEQVVEYWLGESEYRYTPPALRALNIKASQVPVVTGISRVVTANSKRLRCKMTFKDDCYIGGDDMTLVGGAPINAIPVKAGQEVVVDSGGSVNAFVSTNNVNEFATRESIVVNHAKVVQSTLTQDWMNKNLNYIDIDVPAAVLNKDVLCDFTFTNGGGTQHTIFAIAGNRLNPQESPYRLFAKGTANVNTISERNEVVVFKHTKTRLWFYDYYGSNMALSALAFNHSDWDKIHSMVDVIEEML